ncbi:MAG TPA: response regulator transcription factor [Solirubrobacteraceae bacterium]|nr:response regulator transcription factor [Solirubrobacteraceae bacterium]
MSDTDRRPIRVVVAHESYLVREFLTEMLGRTTDVEQSAACSNGTDLQRAIAVWLPDVVLTGTRMPPSGAGEGIQLAGRLRQTAPETGVVVIAERVEPASVLALLDQGTHRRGYLLTERIRSLDELIAAIETVAAGGSVLDPLVVDALVQIRVREARSRLSELTPREHDVLAKLALGDSNGAIARSLCLTKRAVEKHVNSIFSKLDLRDHDSVSPRVKATRIFLTESVPTELRDSPALANHPCGPPPVP